MIGFFQRVYCVVRLVPASQVATYGQVAEIVSHRGAARTVGWALHALEEGTDVPWHRVVGAQGRVAPFLDERGFNVQRRLLEKEGVSFRADGMVDLDRHQWQGFAEPEIAALRQAWRF